MSKPCCAVLLVAFSYTGCTGPVGHLLVATTIDFCAPLINPVACENSRPGRPPSEWQVSGNGDPSLQGFATEISVNHGQTIHFKVNTDAALYHLDVYRLGYYAGLGARRLATLVPSVALPQPQPPCLSDAATGLVDCGNWDESVSWAVPSDAVSGIYFARLVRDDTGGSSQIFFIVRDDEGGARLLFQTADTTWQAYNNYGGNSLYSGAPVGRAYKVSYNRPFSTRGFNQYSWVFGSEYPMVRWLEANGFDVSYTTGVDSDRSGARLLDHKVFLSVGHDEYWSASQRANVETARAGGVHLAFFSGNEIFWKIRWETSIDGSATPYRTLVCYKETHAGAKIDPDPAWTGTWRDPRFSPPSDGGRPENALSGTLFMVNGTQFNAMTVPAADGKMRLWRSTSIASLADGDVATITSGCNCTLGYEWDEERDNGFRPPGLVRLSSTTADVAAYLQDYGSSYAPGRATHHLALYRHPSGALVFGAGTLNWSWALDDVHDGPGSTTDVRVRQATVNLLADMGIQPGTLAADLSAATASADRLAPSSMIVSPPDGSTAPIGTAVVVTGTAADTGGGRVGGVEISVDRGSSWHPADGRDSWSYGFTPTALGGLTILSRAVDDSGNLETPLPGVGLTVTARTCPCSIWSDAARPAIDSVADPNPLEVGVKFRAAVDGFITALRFYKGAGNGGMHLGHLWTGSGQPLAAVTFASETATGWQQVNLPTPVAVTANATYVASYHMDAGGYAVTRNYFAGASFDGPPLTALRDGLDGGDGVYHYGASGFPSDTYQSTNYWVDVVFTTP